MSRFQQLHMSVKEAVQIKEQQQENIFYVVEYGEHRYKGPQIGVIKFSMEDLHTISDEDWEENYEGEEDSRANLSVLDGTLLPAMDMAGGHEEGIDLVIKELSNLGHYEAEGEETIIVIDRDKVAARKIVKKLAKAWEEAEGDNTPYRS